MENIQIENKEFARIIEIKAELEAMGCFCVSWWAKGDIIEEFNSNFSDDHEELTDTELEIISENMEYHMSKYASITSEDVFTLIQDELNKRA